MKTFWMCFVISFLSSLHASEDQIQIVRGGKTISDRLNLALATNIIALFESASVHSTGYAVTNNTWQELLKSDSFVHLKFARPRMLDVMMTPGLGQRQRERTPISEILVPLPEQQFPPHLFAKSGANVLSVTKYNPLALKHVVADPSLRLTAHRPYADLKQIPER